MTERVHLFDDWAGDYDSAVDSSGGEFPFDGYERALARVVERADVEQQMRVLDLGVGTGNLASLLVHNGCTVWGIDFSEPMLAQARAKVPQVKLVHADLLGDWPAELQQRFDRVVSAYVLHEFDLDTKIDLLQEVATRYLSAKGRIVIADVAFESAAQRLEASRRWASDWDESEFYWAADETLASCQRIGLAGAFEQISSCGGVFTFSVKESSLE